MSSSAVAYEDLPDGLYDRVINQRLRAWLNARAGSVEGELDPTEADSGIAQYVAELVEETLRALPAKEREDRQRVIVSEIARVLVRAGGAESNVGRGEAHDIESPVKRLLAVGDRELVRPALPLARSALISGTRNEPALGSELVREIASADRVEILCSFIKWSGLVMLLGELRKLTASPHPDGPRLRVITTSYMGATEARAVEELQKLPNTEVRVSYDTTRTRLHAKAYLIHRASGFGSAYIGSANLGNAAMSSGLEWTSKISQYELPYLWQRIVATFEAYTNDPEFTDFDASQYSRLREALKDERRGSNSDDPFRGYFDLRPYPFQEEILESIAAERANAGKRAHLVVAATGTGKTMIAAFDYKRWAATVGGRPSLLFIAHRKEILQQSLATFRAVLRDHNFGELLVGGLGEVGGDHLFCSIQSYQSRAINSIEPERYRYLVVDEFHHAAAPSYQALLERLKPEVLLGLTATPERADSLDIRGYFGGELTAEIRLPDAINRRLLCPFQYFGVSDVDSANLESLKWTRGGYDTAALEGLYTGNDVRAQMVVDKVEEYCHDPQRVRALGFCVSVKHAEFMAEFFRARGLKAAALSGGSEAKERDSIRQKLVSREINFVFVVDLFNEGVDIPEIDTVLFLRPTESLTVFLQQFGRGLRLHESKECLTVLDFIAAHRKEYRFGDRLSALGTMPVASMATEVENGNPHLPPGCSVQFEKIAKERVLANLAASLRFDEARVVERIRVLGDHSKKVPTFAEGAPYLVPEFAGGDLAAWLKRGVWSRWLVKASLKEGFSEENEGQLAKGFARLSHMNDPRMLRRLIELFENGSEKSVWNEEDATRLAMMHSSLWSREEMTLEVANQRLHASPVARGDLVSLLQHLLLHSRVRVGTVDPESPCLTPHSMYTRDEALIGLGKWKLESERSSREGVVHIPERKIDAFFVTLSKSESTFSPTTMYHDYAISDRLFHWQTQNSAIPERGVGERYITHLKTGYTPLLFVRERQYLPSGMSEPFVYLGPCEFVSFTGRKPMSIVWRLRHAIPARVLRYAAKQAVA